MYVRILLIVLGIVVVFAASGYHLAYSVVSDKRSFEEQAREWALQRTEIKEITEIAEYRGRTNCAVVFGKNAQGTPVIAWLTKDTQFMDTVAGTVPKDSVLQTVQANYKDFELQHAVPGIEGKETFWEVVLKGRSGGYLYLYYDFHTGKMLRSYTIHAPTTPA